MSITIKADFTCDNNYAIWLGDGHSVHTKVKEFTNTKASQIFNGEHFSFLADKQDFLYVLAWSDDRGVQGLLGTFNGGRKIQMGDPNWLVLPTGKDKDNSQFPTLTEINSSLTIAIANDWKRPFIGPTNASTNQLFKNNTKPVKNIDLNANWVWYNSGRDTRTGGSYNATPPFKGFNHDEFLIFKIPVKDLTTCCGPCEDGAVKFSKELEKRALTKTFIIKGSLNDKKCIAPYSNKECSVAKIPEIKPCFHLHWGDSKRDQIETHDDEVLYITACNPYGNLNLKGLKISSINITPSGGLTPNGEKAIQIIPDRLICFEDINGCSCSSREFTLLTRGAIEQSYKIEIEYCIDIIEINQFNTGKTGFEIELINS